MKAKIYLKNVVELLEDFSDKKFQVDIWLNTNNPKGLVSSFVETSCMLFDDCVIGDYLENGEVILDHKVTQGLQELHDAVAAVDEFRSEQQIINDPLMEVVRQKASEVLRLISASNLEGNTVRIVEPGEE